MKTMKSVLHRMLAMCPAAWRVYLFSLQLSCALLLLSLMLYTGVLPEPGGSHLAAAFYELPQAVLLIGLIGSVCVEDVCSRSS